MFCEMTLSQLHRSQHTLFGISQHSRHLTSYMRKRIHRVPSHQAQKKHQTTRAEIPGQKYGPSLSGLKEEDTIALFTPDDTFA